MLPTLGLSQTGSWTAEQVFQELTRPHALDRAWIDVRSEGEFQQNAIPGFVNLPILNHLERHEVGLCYRSEGRDAAIQQGYALMNSPPQPSLRVTRTQQWIETLNRTPLRTAVVTCFRGGLRSQIACDWIRQAGHSVVRVEGGTKALRNLALQLLNPTTEQQPFLIVAGLTGSGKTNFLKNIHKKNIKIQAVDIEHHAAHRGSSFGSIPSLAQPSQACFENRLALDFFAGLTKTILLEDESLRIGSVALPLALKNKMLQSPTLWIEDTLENRCQRIYTEYVLQPLQSKDLHLQARLRQQMLLLQKPLGLARTLELVQQLTAAFQAEDPSLFTLHQGWIERLLKEYYDLRYQFAWKRTPRAVVFKGTPKECEQWIQIQYG